MTASYKVGRIVLATLTAIILYLAFLGVVGLACVSPYVIYNSFFNDYRTSDDFMGFVGSCFVTGVIAGLNIVGFVGAIKHHLICLIIYACVHFFGSLILLLITVVCDIPFGAGVFAFIAINSTFTVIPLYLAYRIKNNNSYSRSN
ncbi:hypothetical protein HDE_08405 [Halotydeus destructor]|nr:hypothetical protein HDE_08405 [Halotydeus destructor]